MAQVEKLTVKGVHVVVMMMLISHISQRCMCGSTLVFSVLWTYHSLLGLHLDTDGDYDDDDDDMVNTIHVLHLFVWTFSKCVSHNLDTGIFVGWMTTHCRCTGQMLTANSLCYNYELCFEISSSLGLTRRYKLTPASNPVEAVQTLLLDQDCSVLISSLGINQSSYVRPTMSS